MCAWVNREFSISGRQLLVEVCGKTNHRVQRTFAENDACLRNGIRAVICSIEVTAHSSALLYSAADRMSLRCAVTLRTASVTLSYLRVTVLSVTFKRTIALVQTILAPCPAPESDASVAQRSQCAIVLSLLTHRPFCRVLGCYPRKNSVDSNGP